MNLSRALSVGGVLGLVAGIVLAVAGASVPGFAVAALGAVALTSWAFLLVGQSEDRERERERRERRGR
jgi:hypothetical protein